ncbi:MAG TPA: tetratricopeptide repeat protein [Candidatus Bathyarchaeia archaeon]|nr:tetratricopeptide repeat protein [Candidatus Bathyarchaeia archaeon]
MKKAAAGCFAAACVIAVVAAILASIGSLRQEKIREWPPLTLQELDRLSKALKKPEVPAENAVTPPNPTDQSPAEARSIGQNPPADLPRRLNRPATDEERREQFMRGKSARNRLIAVIGSSPLGGFVDALGVAVGIPEGALANRGECYMARGKWDEAKSCYSEFVRKSKDPVMLQIAHGRLAWLEDDPELAARYMELASSGEQAWPIALCRSLAWQTGSTVLAQHYQALFERVRAEAQEPDR